MFFNITTAASLQINICLSYDDWNNWAVLTRSCICNMRKVINRGFTLSRMSVRPASASCVRVHWDISVSLPLLRGQSYYSVPCNARAWPDWVPCGSKRERVPLLAHPSPSRPPYGRFNLLHPQSIESGFIDGLSMTPIVSLNNLFHCGLKQLPLWPTIIIIKSILPSHLPLAGLSPRVKTNHLAYE